LERLRSKIVVDALGSTALTMHLPECFRDLKPGVQLKARTLSGLVDVLARSSSETVR
jgi:hypothetical protein